MDLQGHMSGKKGIPSKPCRALMRTQRTLLKSGWFKKRCTLLYHKALGVDYRGLAVERAKGKGYYRHDRRIMYRFV